MRKNTFGKRCLILLLKIAILIFIPYIIVTVANKKSDTSPKQVSGNVSAGIIGMGKNVKFSDGGLMDINQFIPLVLAKRLEMSKNEEVLKAQAVMIRTDIMRIIGDGVNISVDDCGFDYVSKDKISDGDYALVGNAVSATGRQVIKYNGNLIEAKWTEVSDGKSMEDAGCEYLKSVELGCDTQSPKYLKISVMSNKEFAKKLGILDDNPLDLVQIVSKSSSGYVMKIQVGNKVWSGSAFANVLGIPSTAFQLDEADGKVQITSRGVGEGYGVSIYAAQVHANQGMNYEEILKKFYSGIELE